MNPQLNFFDFKRAALVLAVAALLPVAQTENAPVQAEMPHHAAAPPMTSGGGMDMKAMMKTMSGMMTAMPMTGDSDVDFAKMMRIHHQGAIDMAETELRNGKHAEMTRMASAIVSAQKKEIEQIDEFLKKHALGTNKNVK